MTDDAKGNPYEPPATIQSSQVQRSWGFESRMSLLGLVMGAMAGWTLFLFEKFDGQNYYSSLLKHAVLGSMFGNLVVMLILLVRLLVKNARKLREAGDVTNE